MTENKRIITLSIIIGLIISVGAGFFTKAYSDTIQEGISNQVIRFHVLANSDSEEDQNLKLKVRDGILAEYRYDLEKCGNIDETRTVLQSNLDGIKKCAENIIASEGYNYGVSVSLEKGDMFPTKTYGDISFPAGEYEALRVVIGDGNGHNWWCVMFPPLCYVDVTHSEIPEDEKDKLKHILTDEEYDIVSKSNKNNLPVKVKFKIVEMWQEKFL